MRTIYPLCFLVIPVLANAQFPIGRMSHTFTDPNRNNRQIECEIFYPATSTGVNAPGAEGEFPVVVFGHGFVMNYTAYENLWLDLVPEGYILSFVNTELSFLPSHQNFALDIRFVSTAITAFNTNPSSVLHNRIAPQRAFAGHSMGGGATWLAAAGITSVQCIIGLAPANTNNPTTLSQAPDVQVPALVLSGSSDGVTTPAFNHQPIYNATGSSCKAFANLINGSHCYFAQEGSLCDLGEIAPGSMTRQRQQQITKELMLYWLNYYLKSDVAAIAAFAQYGDEASDVTITNTCDFLSASTIAATDSVLPYPNPFADTLSLKLNEPGCPDDWLLFTSEGRQHDLIFYCEAGRVVILGHDLAQGSYVLHSPALRKSWRIQKS